MHFESRDDLGPLVCNNPFFDAQLPWYHVRMYTEEQKQSRERAEAIYVWSTGQHSNKVDDEVVLGQHKRKVKRHFEEDNTGQSIGYSINEIRFRFC